jgi:hypothetical protein
MNSTTTSLLAVAFLALGGAALAQTPSADSNRGNAPLKASHAVTDTAPSAGATSFTQGGYDAVSALNKGPDGVWRGTATKGGVPVSVALDFKGDVTETPAASH